MPLYCSLCIRMLAAACLCLRMLKYAYGLQNGRLRLEELQVDGVLLLAYRNMNNLKNIESLIKLNPLGTGVVRQFGNSLLQNYITR